MTTPSLSPLQARVAREIVAIVRRERRSAGDHLPESALAQEIGTSRSPVQAALRYLATLGVVERDAHRGYFLRRPAEEWSELAHALYAAPDDPLYLKIAEARLAGQLPDEVNESELMRRYGVARSTLRDVLGRISQEGWIEQRVGHGWCFLPMIDSAEAYEESYLFRRTLEPAGLASASFSIEPGQLAELRREQEGIINGGYRTMSAIELFESNSRFHETLAEWSHNRFIAQAIRRVNQQRRLIEYRAVAKRGARRVQAEQHLEIIEALERGQVAHAVALLKEHLEGARRTKVHHKTLAVDHTAQDELSAIAESTRLL